MNAMEINEQQFRELREGGKPLLVEFWAPWCTYCRRIGPAFDLVAQEQAEAMTVAKINIDGEPSLARQEQIQVIPTLVLYRAGKMLGSVTAPESKAAIDAFVRETLDSL